MSDYDRIIAFTKVSLPFGWLGNMAPYPVRFQGSAFRTSEALFQCLRFDDEAIKSEIKNQRSPMHAKMVAKKHRERLVVQPRSEQDMLNMEWVLAIKCKQHAEIGRFLLQTGEALIIEDCSKRPNKSGLFWGAQWKGGKWQGKNVLGKLWMALREMNR